MKTQSTDTLPNAEEVQIAFGERIRLKEHVEIFRPYESLEINKIVDNLYD
jgi:hypothetical protein